MKDTVRLKLVVGAVIFGLLLLFLSAYKAYADERTPPSVLKEPTPPAVLKEEPPTITILDWCAGPATYASALVLSIRKGYTKQQVSQFMVEQMAAIEERTGQQMQPDQLITMIGILDRAYEMPKEEMVDLYGAAKFVQGVADECAKKIEKMNEEAEKGLTI